MDSYIIKKQSKKSLIEGGYTIHYIYLDVLIVLNIYVNYFLLQATAKLTHIRLTLKRCLLASAVGSLFALIILFPKLNIILNLLIKLISSAIIISLAFGLADKRQTGKLILYFYVINFIFAGVMLTIWLMFKPSFMQFNNSFFYVDFSLISLVICTIIAYIAVCIVRFIMDRGTETNGHYSIIIRNGEQIFTLEGLADTGNSLTDSFTGKPVIICSEQKLKGLVKKLCLCNLGSLGDITDFLMENKHLKGLHIIPFLTIGESGTIAVFRADEVVIKEQESNRSKKVDVLIGISEQDIKAVFNPKILV